MVTQGFQGVFEDPADNAAYDALLSELFRADTLTSVIRVAIRVEQQLDAYFDSRVSDPAELRSMRLDFGQKVQLAVALGLRQDLKSPLKAFATIRNAYAHKPDYELGQREVDNFYRTLSADQKALVQGFMHMSRGGIDMSEPHVTKFRWAITVLHLGVTAWRRVNPAAGFVEGSAQPRLR